ncbi:hypothetical protein V8C86DRAFT_1528735 [Haematococcus lacustris]
MNDVLLVEEVHPGTSVVAAVHGRFEPEEQKQRLLLCCGDTLLLWEPSVQNDSLQLVQRIPLFQSFQCLVAMAVEMGQLDMLVGVTPEATAIAFLLHRDPAGSWGVREVAATQLHPSAARSVRRIDGIRACKPVLLHGVSTCVLSIYHDCLHAVRLGPGGSLESSVLSTQLLCGAVPGHPSIDATTQPTVHVHGIELVGTGARHGPLAAAAYVAVLQSVQGSGFSSVDLECLQLVWPAGSTGAGGQQQAALQQGPWSCRRLHPTTQVLAALPATRHLAAGVAAISSVSLLFISLPAPVSSYTHTHGQPPITKQHLLRLTLAGVPACCCLVRSSVEEGHLLVLGDGMAGLHLLQLGGPHPPWSCTLQLGGPVAPPSLLLFLPAPTSPPPCINHGNPAPTPPCPAGWLLLGSQAGHTQLLSVPSTSPHQAHHCQQQLLSQSAAAAPPPDNRTRSPEVPGSTPGASAAAGAEVPGSTPGAGSGWVLSEAALVKSLAPVQDALTLPDPEGAPDLSLLLACGQAPAGRLARAQLAVGLVPYLVDGPLLPEGAQLFALSLPPPPGTSPPPASPASPHTHTHLALSFPTAACTRVLDLRGASISPALLPGLDPASPSLLLHTAPGPWLLQATPRELRVIGPDRGEGCSCCLAHTWLPPPTPAPPPGQPAAALPDGLTQPAHISLAAADGGWVAVVVGQQLVSLAVEELGGAVRVVGSRQLDTPASALTVAGHHPGCSPPPALFPPPPAAIGARQGAATSPLQPQGGGVPVVMLGQWLGHSLLLLPADRLVAPLLALDLGEETARSAALLPVPVPASCSAPTPPARPGAAGLGPTAGGCVSERWLLAVGTNTGLLLLWDVAVGRGEGAGGGGGKGGGWQQAWVASCPRQLRISNVAVELSLHPGDPSSPSSTPTPLTTPPDSSPSPSPSSPYLYARSGNDAIIRTRAPSSHPLSHLSPQLEAGEGEGQGEGPSGRLAAPQLVEVCRVFGARRLSSLVACGLEGLGRGCAWVTAAGRLMFGQLDPALRLRWRTAYMGDTPQHLAYHSASHCLVVLSQSSCGEQWLRLVDLDSLQPLVALRLARQHCFSSLLVTPLPCSSSSHPEPSAAASSPCPPPPPCPRPTPSAPAKQFIVLGSSLLLPGQLPDSGSSQQGPGSAPTQAHGLVSVLDIVRSHTHHTHPAAPAAAAPPPAAQPPAQPPPGQGGPQAAFQLRLMGVVPVPGVPLSLAISGPLNKASSSSSSSSNPAGREGKAGGGGAREPASSQAGPTATMGSTRGLPAQQQQQQQQQAQLSGGNSRQQVQHAQQQQQQQQQRQAGQGRGPSARQQGGKAAAAAAAAEGEEEENKEACQGSASGPLLLVGGSQGVQAYSCWVDDAGTRGQQAVGEALQATLRVDGLPAFLPPPSDLFECGGAAGGAGGAGGQGPGGGSGGSVAPSIGVGQQQAEEEEEEEEEDVLERFARLRPAPAGTSPDGDGAGQGGQQHAAEVGLQEQLRRDWSLHLHLSLVDQAASFAGFAVTSIACKDDLVLAADFMASVTLLQLLPGSKAGRPGRSVRLHALAADHTPLYAQASLLANRQQVLVAVHPRGLALLSRDKLGEQEAQRKAQAAADREAATGREAIRQRGGGPRPPGPGRWAGCTAADCSPLRVSASCHLRRPIIKLLPGSLGLDSASQGHGQGQDSMQQPDSAAASSSSSGGGAMCGGVGAHGDGACFLGVGSDGSVVGVRVASGRQGPRLLALQRQAQAQQAVLGLGLPASCPHVATWRLQVPHPPPESAQVQGVEGEGGAQTLPATCVEMNFLQQAATAAARARLEGG